MTNKCSFCGACIAGCPNSAIGLNEGKPKLVGRCITCQFCYYNCPVISFEQNAVENRLFSRVRNPEESLGIIEEIWNTNASTNKFKNPTQYGTSALALAAYLLDKNLLDGVLIAKASDKPWEQEPAVARTSDELASAVIGQYYNTFNLRGLREAVVVEELAKVGVVGLPDQIKAIRIMQTSEYGNIKLGGKVNIAISLFSRYIFSFEKMFEEFLRGQKGIKTADITQVKLEPKRLVLTLKGGSKESVAIDEISNLSEEMRYQCDDPTGAYADLSIVNTTTYPGKDTILVRTKVGKELLESAIKDGYLKGNKVENTKAVLQELDTYLHQ